MIANLMYFVIYQRFFFRNNNSIFIFATDKLLSMRKFLYIILCVELLLCISCKHNPLNVDVSDIEANVQIERFDLDFYACSENISFSSVSKLAEKYPSFFEEYNEQIISCGSYNDMAYYDCLKVFFADYSVVEAHNAVNEIFADCTDVQEIINDGFRHLLYYFPNEKLPRVVTFVAGFNQSVVFTEGYVGIGLDKYLGADCKLYDMMQIPDFAKAEMQRKRIPIDIMTGWFGDKFPFEPEIDNLANNMIYNGVKLYFLEAMFPDMPETDRLTYTDSQLDFCENYETEIWTSLVESGSLFSTDSFTIKKFTENAPFTSQFGPDSPPRVANWVGLQIVKSYMKENEVSLQELLAEKDYQKILNMSGYTPR